MDRVGVGILVVASALTAAVAGFAPRHPVHKAHVVAFPPVKAASGTYQGVPKIADVPMHDGSLLSLVAYSAKDGRTCVGIGRAEHNLEYAQHCAAASELPVVLAMATGPTNGSRAIVVVGPAGGKKIAVFGLNGTALTAAGHPILVAAVPAVSLRGYAVAVDGKTYGVLHAIRTVDPCPDAEAHAAPTIPAPQLCGTA